MAQPRLHIVLLNPEIPQNTGNIGRTVAAIPRNESGAGCRLHLIHPLGFEMTEKAFRRAGLDYWHLVDCVQHESWEAFLADENPPPGRLWLYTTKATRPHWEAAFREGDYLLFGRETTGAPAEVLEWVDRTHGEDHRITLPMNPHARSLNLSTVVCAAAYEALRQMETSKRLNVQRIDSCNCSGQAALKSRALQTNPDRNPIMLTIQKALLTVVGTAAGLTVIGGIIGGLLGVLTPGYYRQMFRMREDVTPVELGIGLGVTNGGIWGLIIGILLVAIIAWKESRIARNA